MGTNNSKQIEVEFRSRFDKDCYTNIEKFLGDNGTDLGQDDKEVVFFIYPDKTIKVVNAISQNTAKIALKMNRLGNGSDFEEVEVPFDPNYFPKVERIFEQVSKCEIQKSFQKRHNYMYKEVEIALKHSDSWGYHLEMEQVISDLKDKELAEKNIQAVAKELGISLMTDEEIIDFCKTIDQKPTTMYSSLVTLAEQKQLPEHQVMDPQTVEWIEANKPSFSNTSKLSFGDGLLDAVVRFAPRKKWFFIPYEANGIHGVRHISRVLIHALILSSKQEYSSYTQNLAIAASLHDIARFDDQGDLGHGRRAAGWFKNNLDSVSSEFGVNLSADDAEEIYWSIFFHETPLQEIEQDPNYIKHKTIIDLLKTADALDRYRLPKLKWWINPEYLSIKPSTEHLEFAFNLCLNSEKSAVVAHGVDKSVIEELKVLISSE